VRVPGSGERLERRKHERLVVRVPLYVVVEGEIFQKMVEMESNNISKGGLSFETRREIPVGSEALVMVSRLGDLPSSAQIKGQIIYCRPNADAGAFSVGLKFSQFVSVTPDELLARIESWKKERQSQDPPS
jgi:hypothetical protein